MPSLLVTICTRPLEARGDAPFDFASFRAQLCVNLMRWFFITFATVTAILFLSFIAWIVTRVMHLDAANYYVGKIMIYDLYGVAVIVAYSAFVGGWHLWEKLTGRMEAEASAGPTDQGAK